MNRRGFLSLIGKVAGAIGLAPYLPKTRPQLAFHPKAFAFAMEPLRDVTRMDVIYGIGTINPGFAFRYYGDDGA